MQDLIQKQQQYGIWQWQNVHEWRIKSFRQNMQNRSSLNKLRQHVLCCETVLVNMLENEFNMPLKLQLLDQTQQKCSYEHAQLLGIATGNTCWRRRVKLHLELIQAHTDTKYSCLFDAESWLPQRHITDDLLVDLQSGNVPLGRLLQGDKLALQRKQLAIGYNSVSDCWGRRSLLYADSGVKALVYEFFTPTFWQYLIK